MHQLLRQSNRLRTLLAPSCQEASWIPQKGKLKNPAPMFQMKLNFVQFSLCGYLTSIFTSVKSYYLMRCTGNHSSTTAQLHWTVLLDRMSILNFVIVRWFTIHAVLSWEMPEWRVTIRSNQKSMKRWNFNVKENWTLGRRDNTFKQIQLLACRNANISRKLLSLYSFQKDSRFMLWEKKNRVFKLYLYLTEFHVKWKYFYIMKTKCLNLITFTLLTIYVCQSGAMHIIRKLISLILTLIIEFSQLRNSVTVFLFQQLNFPTHNHYALFRN